MSLMRQCLNEMKSDPKKFGYNSDTLFLRTGFDCIDYLNGQYSVIDGQKKLSLGIGGGKIMQIIGKSGSGKSTLAIQMATNIIRKYSEGQLILFDFEQSNSYERIRMVTGLTEEQCSEDSDGSMVAIKRTGISTETFKNTIIRLRKFKEDHKKELLVENQEGIYDKDGKLVKVLPPTIVIVDSVPLMVSSNDLNDEDMESNMAAAQRAKSLAGICRGIVQSASSANITVIFINHIQQKIETNPMLHSQAQINYLKQDETLPGGSALIYVTDTLLKVVTASKLEPDKTYGIKGFEARVELVKSRTSAAGRSVTLVYDQYSGFDNTLSTLNYINACNGLCGSGRGYYFDGLETEKFKFSNFKDRLAESKALSQKFDAVAKLCLENSVAESSKINTISDLVLDNISETIEETTTIDE